jgi:arginyl-tRNA synthetase
MLAWQKYGNGETPESSGKKGDHLVGDYYVAFDKHYKQEVATLMEQGMSKEEAEAASPLMNEAREMLVKWEAGDREVRDLWTRMNQWVERRGEAERYRRNALYAVRRREIVARRGVERFGTSLLRLFEIQYRTFGCLRPVGRARR